MASSFDRVNTHLQSGVNTPLLGNDAEVLLRRCEFARCFASEYGEISLSPHMQKLLGISRPVLLQAEQLQSRLVSV